MEHLQDDEIVRVAPREFHDAIGFPAADHRSLRGALEQSDPPLRHHSIFEQRNPAARRSNGSRCDEGETKSRLEASDDAIQSITVTHRVQFTRAYRELQKRPFFLIGFDEMEPRARRADRHRNRGKPAATAEVEDLPFGFQDRRCSQGFANVRVDVPLRFRPDQVYLARPRQE